MVLDIELEEWVGKRWHRWASRAASYRRYPEAGVALAQVHGALAVFFRASGGEAGLSLEAISERESGHRLSLRQRLGFASEWLPQPRLDEQALRLPPILDVLPSAALNRDLYFWLAAYFAQAPAVVAASDPLQHDILALRTARHCSAAVLRRYPGLAGRYRRLCAAALAQRPRRRHLPPVEAAVEAAIRALLGDDSAAPSPPHAVFSAVFADRVEERVDDRVDDRIDHPAPLAGLSAPAGYRRFLPVPLWGDALHLPSGGDDSDAQEEDRADGAEDEQAVAGGARKASRRRQDQAERDDPLIFNRFEKMLSFADMVNLNRMVDDEPDANASKTAEQLDELTLSPQQRKAASRLQVQLDLAPGLSIAGALQGDYRYPEWDYRRQCYQPAQSRVLLAVHDEHDTGWQPGDATLRRVRRIQRQFEALRPRRVTLRAQPDGADLDTDAAVRGLCDQLATGVPSEGIYLDTRPGARDLAVSVLVDNSLSTEAWLADRRIIDVIREAVWVLSHGLATCGDDHAISTFTSHRRNKVWIKRIKGFDEPLGAPVERRIAALGPGSYTRMGPAIRHASAELALRPNRFRLLLLLSDGKPNDTDYYEGRYAIEDTRRAVLDARQQDIRVFAITVDREAGQYIPRLFGRGAYAMVDHPEKLSEALPRLYRQITGQ
ncbi:protein norD [Parahaliea mediterranea]|uniref:protein norD n=1 Tax=Parahaliea mediterranea TaxID=651086 RepID=UPI000E2EEB7E|nr:protein norD [Parahaliea mediterranea]